LHISPLGAAINGAMSFSSWKKRSRARFFHWSLYTAHHNRGMDFGDHSKMEVLFEIETIRGSGKAAKKWLMKNRKWGGQ
jgi:hypothetical protein